LRAAPNDYSGWVGMQILVGANPLTVSELGRIVVSGNIGSHTVKLVRASDGLDVAGGEIAIATAGGTPGEFKFAALASPVTLNANTTYFVLSQETFGGDIWYDNNTSVVTTAVATDNAAVWGTGLGDWHPIPLANKSYVPVSFKY
jgi:hypothetical protein